MTHLIDWPPPSVLHLIGGAAIFLTAAAGCWCAGYPHTDSSDTAGRP